MHKFYILIFAVLLIVFVSAYDLYSLVSAVSGFVSAWIFIPIFQNWLLDRKKKKLENMKKEIARLEKELKC